MTAAFDKELHSDKWIEAAKKFAEEQKRGRKCCENCGWFAVRGDETIGECHRYPPTHATLADDEWKHARTHRENICGEFVHRRTGDSFQPDPYRAVAVRLARAEDEIDRLRRSGGAE
jgi:hypothetical protein